ncbi:MAG: filamentous hemagglutinin family protein [Burkholderiaceae bacterium]
MVTRSLPRSPARCLGLRLTPLAAALALAWQGAAMAAPPAPNTVPVPASTWRVNGSGKTSAPVNTPNAQGGTSQVIDQTSARAIYQWQSFDIGANSDVTFDMAVKGASALNRVTGSAAPSQIFGQLRATNRGEIYLINANGILFGRGAQVNTGSLIASTLNVGDSEYLSGFAQSLAHPADPALNAAFRYDGDAARFVDSQNFVRVDEGATITTDSGGRVFLFAKKVDNAGQITAPDGQVVLAGGGAVYLKLPDSESKLYASETNPAVSAVRGFLVEVGAGPAGAPEGTAGSATNAASGLISTPRGNTTLVGMAVNQMGRIRATTSVSENGSVVLRAQGNAEVALNDSGTQIVMRAQDSGALVLGAGSRIEIAPDNGSGSTPATSTDSAGFATSHIDIAGHSVVFEDGASIVAPGATVNVRAERKPSYAAHLTTDGGALAAGDDDSRIVLGANTLIDVSGTTDTVRSVGDLFVTTELLGSNDLKDAPLQKDGLLYRSQATLDTRSDSAILGSLDSYRAGIDRTVGERLSAGGHVDLRAEGAMLTHESSSIRVSGGQVRYTAADVQATRLVAENGAVYDLASAPTDLVYTSAVNLQKPGAIEVDRWGQQTAYGAIATQHEAGYTEGRAAGSVSIAAPVVQLQGELKAGTTVGERQAAGLDKAASAGSLTLGATVNGQQRFTDTSGSNPGPNAVLGNFSLSASGPVVDAGVWSAPLETALGGESGLSASRLAAAGFGDVTVVANGDVRFEHSSDAAFRLHDGGSLNLWSGYGNVLLAQDLRGAGASVSLLSRDKVTADPAGNPLFKRSGSVEVADGVSVDLSGQWVNQWLDGLQSTAATGGGSFSASGFGVRLGTGSVVDVSGGAWLSTKGSFNGAAAGAIALEDFTYLGQADHQSLMLDGTLRGYAAQSTNGVATGGGRLSLKTTRVVVSDQASDQRTDALNLGSGFFSEGGFGSFAIDGRLSLDVAPGTVVAPVQAWRQARVDARDQASADIADNALADGLAPGVRRAGVNLGLASSGDGVDDDQGATGVLTIGAGAVLRPGDQAKVALQAAHRLVDLGRIETHGGQVSLALKASSAVDANVLWLGEGARIDVSGTTVLTPGTTDGLLHGSVLDGGSISLSAGSAQSGQSSLVLQEGATLDARGALGLLDVTERSAAGVRTSRQQVASHGGSVSLSGNADMLLEAAVDLRGGATTAAGGSLAVTQLAARSQVSSTDTGAYNDRTLTVTTATSHETRGLTLADLADPADLTGRVVVASDWVGATGASDLKLTTPGVLQLAGDVDLQVARNLQLNTRAIAGSDDGQARLSAANVWLGTNRADVLTGSGDLQPVAASEGNATLQIHASSGVVLDGQVVTQAFSQLAVASGGEMRLQSREGPTGGRYVGGLDTRADLQLSATQIYPATDSDYTVNAPGHTVAFAGGDAGSAKPLSAHGALVVDAADIEQAGVLRAPLGRIELHATGTVDLAAGSETSVSADGLNLLYGTTNGSASTWTTPAGTRLDTPPDKQIVLDAATVDTAAGSLVDVRGGGELVGTEFVPGKGGSADILAGGNGAYAIVPTVQGLAPHDPAYAGSAAAPGRQIVISQAVTLPDGSPLPAGRYTLLPARYAMLDGAFLLRPATGAGLADGSVVARTDGSVNVGARLGDAGTAFTDALPGTWQLMSKATALKYSEVRETKASDFFAAQAAKAGVAAPQLPRDGGSLVIQAQQADLQGQGRFAGAAAEGSTAAGQAGTLEVVASAIEVDAHLPAATGDGVLHLGADQLNQYAGGTIVLGGRSNGSDAHGTRLDVQARSVVFDQGSTALSVSGLVAVATDEVAVHDGAVFRPVAASSGASTPTTFSVEGGGAALRVDAAPGAGLARATGSTDSATLDIGRGAVFDASHGSLVLDSSGSNHIARNARLDAADVLVAGGRMALGATGAPEGTLALTPAQLAALSDADKLTLRAYERMNFAAGSTLGSATLDQLVLDTPMLSVAGTGQPVQVTAGDLTLTNSTGRAPGVQAGGSGQLTLSATAAQGGSGQLHLGAGHVAVAGASQLTLQADRAVSLQGQGVLVASGDLSLHAPVLVAGEAAAEHQVRTPGTVRILASGDGAVASADGAVFDVGARSVQLSGRIVLPSGQVSLSGVDGVRLDAGGAINTAGRSVAIDNQTVNQAGGQVTLSSSAGDVVLAGGSRIDVSGAGAGSAGGGRGGALGLSAAQGEVVFDGQLLGRSGSDAPGATLAIDAGHDLRLTQLSHQVEGGQFSGELSLRQREGDMTVSPGATLASNAIALSADQGRLTIAGTLDASGAEGGDITLAAGGDLNLGPGARLLASSSQAGADGGRVALSTGHGWVRFMPDSLIDLRAGAATDTTTPDGGRLTVRAPQLGRDVAVGVLNGEIQGASQIDVQAVKVYEGYTALGPSESGSTLGQGHIASDAARFLGADGENAERIATRLLAHAPGLSSALRVHAEAEVRASGDFAVLAGADWRLPTESVSLPGAAHVGDTSLTLRAAGDLAVNRGLSSGIAADGTASSDHGGDIRLVAGADLGAARVDATDRAAAHTLTLAPQSAGFFDQATSTTGSSTGDVTLAASGDVALQRWGTYVQTTGRRPDEAAAAVADRLASFGTPPAFSHGGGDLRVSAGGSVTSSDYRPDLAQYVGLYGWARQLQALDGSGDFGWYTARNVNRGLLSQGGGAIDVRAGRDVSHLVALAPGSGYRLNGSDGGAAVERHLRGGSVQVRAGRDIVDGVFEAGGEQLVLAAGRDIAQRDNGAQLNPGTRVYHEGGAVHVDARRDLTLAQLGSRYANYGNGDSASQNIQGLDDGARATVTAAAGHLRLSADATVYNEDNALIALPDHVHLAAPNGTLAIDAPLLQQPAADGSLVALAGQGLAMHGDLVVNATQTSAAPGARWESAEQALAETTGLLTDGEGRLDQSRRSPVQLATAAGDLEIAPQSGLALSARPLRLSAGGDVLLSGIVQAQQQPDAATGATTEQTVLRAGRDIVLHDSAGVAGSLQVGGPGEVLLLAGRDINLGDYNGGASFGSGLMATGNNANGLLPKAGAAVTLVAGLRLDGSDYGQAVAAGFEVVGTGALLARAGDLYALQTAAEGQPVRLDSDAAKAFDAKGTAAQLDALKALWGEAATNAALAGYVRGLPGHEQDSDTAALAAFSSLTPARQAAAPASLLAGRLAGVASAARTDFLVQVAQADTPRYAAAMQAWLKQKTGQDLALADAIAAFERLPVERQAGWLNQVLVEELRTAGRTAAGGSGSDKDAAYLRGYLAIDTVFPGARPAGDIQMPSTQVKTLQDAATPLLAATDQARAIELGGITLLAPGGGVNAGEVSASGQPANNLGIVTVAGGDIAAVVKNDFMVNQSRVFSLAEGDILLWSSTGDIDAGRGAKTVTGAPAPVLRLDPQSGQLYLDTSGSFTGSGIAVLDEHSDLDLYAPAGAIDAGEAGIRARGNVFVGAVSVRGADNFQVGGSVTGATLGAVPLSLPASAAPSLGDAQKAAGDDEDERRKRRRLRRQLLLDFLGFGPRG